jgi:hypothetical protein
MVADGGDGSGRQIAKAKPPHIALGKTAHK